MLLNTKLLLKQIKQKGICKGIVSYKDIQKWSEHRKSYGKDFPDKTFYVIRRWAEDIGVFSYMTSAVSCFRYCEEKGYIPVVDYQNVPSIYLTNENVGKLNVWEMFFEQPAGYSLDDIKHAKNVILNGGGFLYEGNGIDIFEGEKINIYKPICKNFVRFNDAVKMRFQELWNKFFQPDDIVCGVLFRGSSWNEMRPANHRIQPSVEQVVEDIYKTIDEYKCTKIYLATEDQDAYMSIKNEFGGMLCSVADFSYVGGKNIFKNNDSVTQDEKIQKGINYCASVMILAKAHCLIGGCVSGTIAAQLLSDGYLYKHIFDLGRFPK